METKIIEIYNSLNCHIHTIKGVGMITAAGILSELTNMDKFKTTAQIQAFAGLEPSKNNSGEKIGNGKMVKH